MRSSLYRRIAFFLTWEVLMEKSYFSLLFPTKKNEYEYVAPAFFADLQLAGIVNAILTKYRDFDISRYYYTIPNDAFTVLYRQNIYYDLEHNDGLYTSLKSYIQIISSAKRSFGYYKEVDDPVRKGSYLLLTCKKYIDALSLLETQLKKSHLTSNGLSELSDLLEKLYLDDSFREFEGQIQDAFSHMKEMNLSLLVRDNEISVVEQEDRSENTKCFIDELIGILKQFDLSDCSVWDAEKDVFHLFPSPLSTSPLENAIVDVLKKSRPEVFSVLKKFSEFSFEIEDNTFFDLKDEFAFYLSFFDFEQQLKSVGYLLSYPKLCEDDQIDVEGVYDVALAWKNRFSNYDVVPNNIRYFDHKSFLVVTGPNQGGKTTLARAMGQAIYFFKIGLKVPCNQMKTRFFNRILTHFEVEESVETGAGKLKEELTRLQPMMHIFADDSFVILNELFTTATTYDAAIMGKKVMQHFIHHNCMGIYVTHIRELADEDTNEGVQSMVAQVQPEDSSIRTFKILPMKAMGLGYSDSIVKKYELDYDQVTSRLKNI